MKARKKESEKETSSNQKAVESKEGNDGEAKNNNEQSEEIRVDMSGFKAPRFNPDVFTPVNLGNNTEEITNQENDVRQLSNFLSTNIISEFVMSLCRLSSSIADSEALTVTMHKQGINMRYLGKIVDMLDKIVEIPAVRFSHVSFFFFLFFISFIFFLVCSFLLVFDFYFIFFFIDIKAFFVLIFSRCFVLKKWYFVLLKAFFEIFYVNYHHFIFQEQFLIS